MVDYSAAYRSFGHVETPQEKLEKRVAELEKIVKQLAETVYTPKMVYGPVTTGTNTTVTTMILTPEQKIKELNARVAELTEEVDNLKEELSDAIYERDDWQRESEDLASQLDDANVRIEELQDKLEEIRGVL